MTGVMQFDHAISETKSMDRTLLIGNGFSSEFFSYKNLLEKSNVKEHTAICKLFKEFDTVDFEIVIDALTRAAVVECAYDNVDHARKLKEDAMNTRKLLVGAIKNAHPKDSNELNSKYTSTAKFLGNFAKIFTLNYDLLLYWTVLTEGKNEFSDGFGLGANTLDGRFRGPFRDNANCNIFNLHGGLHLFLFENGETYKARQSQEGIIKTISNEITDNKRLPIFVAEGSSDSKMKKINSVAYLRHCFGKLLTDSAVMFIFGHSASDQDSHIYNAIFNSNTKRVYFGVHNPESSSLSEMRGKLAHYQQKHKKENGSEVEYKFFDSSSAKIWCSDS